MSASTVEQIKAKLGIVDVVSSYLKLERAGGNLKARCPFHTEKTPSFYVSPARESYHCFGCNRGGDIFSFVQEIEGLDFVGALEVLANKAGVEVRPIDTAVKSAKERVYAACAAATKFFVTELAGEEKALAYARGRGLTDGSIASFGIGYVRPEWQSLLNHLQGLGYRDEEIEQAGLIIKTSTSFRHPGGRFYDRFRGRLMFPLTDISGRVVGFSGRLIAPIADQEEAKYINSPQTIIYDKSRLLFGYHQAKTAIREQDACILVEGQLDLVLSHQAGLANTVAVSGTALSEYHLSLIKRLTGTLVMAFDGDKAGIAAARRAIIMALGLDLKVKIALLPEGKDPADLVAEDPSQWLAAVATAEPVIDFCLKTLGRSSDDRGKINQRVTEEVLPFVARLNNAIDRADYVTKVAAFLGVREEPIWDELKKAEQTLEVPNSGGGLSSAASVTTPTEVKTRLLLLQEKLLGLFFWQETAPTKTLSLETLRDEMVSLLGAERYEQALARYRPEADRLAIEAELLFEHRLADLEAQSRELLANLKEELLRTELQLLFGQIKEAEVSDNPTQLETILKRCQAISQEINDLKR